jgi:ATP-binding protein involved in chromosome partitioning
MTELSEAKVKEALQAVEDPALGEEIVKFRIFRGAKVEGEDVRVDIDIPTHAYPESDRQVLEQRITEAVKAAGARNVTVNARVETAWLAPPSEKALLTGTKNIIAVASGKGGVGKSTVAVNLALALKQHGASVGLLDADVFGPSIPQMLGKPETPAGVTDEQKIVPALHHGLRVISVGFFVDKNDAVMWRGPLVHKLLQQFLQDVDWGELDYLVCDLPPGTGDVQLSLSQLIPLGGAVMVTTPQEMSVIDVVKGINMFEKTEVPVLGVVENMAYYLCPSCGHRDEIFSRGGGKRLAQERGLPFLGEIPLDTHIRYGGDSGVPFMIAHPESEHAKVFMKVATDVGLTLARQVLSQPKRSPRLAVIP